MRAIRGIGVSGRIAAIDIVGILFPHEPHGVASLAAVAEALRAGTSWTRSVFRHVTVWATVQAGTDMASRVADFRGCPRLVMIASLRTALCLAGGGIPKC